MAGDFGESLPGERLLGQALDRMGAGLVPEVSSHREARKRHK